jgi:aminomethyltransferase
MLVVNAGNRAKIVEWLERHGAGQACDFSDRTTETAMIAVQGPRAAEVLAPLAGERHRALKYYRAAELQLGSGGSPPALVSRTGYTGEDGWELIVAADAAVEIWARILTAGQAFGAVAAGLGARDTLRLEAAMPLYGHELSESIDPFEAGLGFAVDLEGRTFPGCDALVRLKDPSDRPVRVGWELTGRRVPREGYAVLHQGQPVGHVTSGTFSPTLDRPIAMGYTRAAAAPVGTEVLIDLRGRQEPARVVALPFYRRPSAGRKS